MKIHKYKNWTYWYDRKLKLWVASRIITKGKPIGDVIDAPDRDTLIKYIDVERLVDRTPLIYIRPPKYKIVNKITGEELKGYYWTKKTAQVTLDVEHRLLNHYYLEIVEIKEGDNI